MSGLAFWLRGVEAETPRLAILTVFFPGAFGSDAFFDSLAELHRAAYEERLHAAAKRTRDAIEVAIQPIDGASVRRPGLQSRRLLRESGLGGGVGFAESLFADCQTWLLVPLPLYMGSTFGSGCIWRLSRSGRSSSRRPWPSPGSWRRTAAASPRSDSKQSPSPRPK